MVNEILMSVTVEPKEVLDVDKNFLDSPSSEEESLSKVNHTYNIRLTLFWATSRLLFSLSSKFTDVESFTQTVRLSFGPGDFVGGPEPRPPHSAVPFETDLGRQGRRGRADRQRGCRWRTPPTSCRIGRLGPKSIAGMFDDPSLLTCPDGV